ncbi:fungal pheromone mating factor STE2 GPCR domain-containing protein [Trichoderma barbatum]
MDFDPYTQNITFLALSPSTNSSSTVSIPIPLIDAFNDESASIMLNYAAQLGASITMLLVILFTTPSQKFLRASNLLHILALIVCVVRTVFLVFYFVSPFAHFYPIWANDYSGVPAWNYRTSIAGTVFSTLLMIVTETALMNQAWTMVSLFAPKTKYVVSFLSMLIAIMAISFRVAYTVIQCEGIVDLSLPRKFGWLFKTMLIWNTCSIAWWCALFNSKLVSHLIKNRGVLPSRRAMTPMEVLIMANGILMIVPVIFAILEWVHFINFESGSLTPTSIAIILPLASLAAQRLAQPSPNPSQDPSSYPSDASYQARYRPARDSSRTPLKPGSLFSTTTNNSSAHRSQTTDLTVLAPVRDIIDPIDLELRHIDGYMQPKEFHGRAEPGEGQFHK